MTPHACAHQIEEDEVLPFSRSTEREGSKSSGRSRRFFSMPSSTARPPAWMQKWSMAALKEGRYRLGERLSKDHTTRSCSERGSTSGPSCVRLTFIALPATSTIFLESRTPVAPEPSSHWKTAEYDSSSVICVRTK